MITTSTLNFWLAKNGISVINIGLFSVISLPYAINFLWAPLIDLIKIPLISQKYGLRQSWIIFLGACLAVTIGILSILNPRDNLWHIAVVGILISFLSSSLDIVLGAFRSEILTTKNHGPASGVYLFGYRLGMVISKSGAIYLSYFLEWSSIYHILISILLLILGLILLNAPRHKLVIDKHESTKYHGLRNFIINVLSPIGNFKTVSVLLLFLILYRLPDNVLNNMISPFLLHNGFNEIEISLAGYLCGSITSIIGGMIAGAFIEKIGVYKSLLYFGTLHALGHLLFILFGIFGREIYLLTFVISIEGLTGGMAMASYITLITSLCKGRYKATQYSMFSAMMGVSRSLLPSLSGILVLQLGWSYFFVIIFLLSLPSLYILNKYLIGLKK
jgi:PAT family beta-lactamase induction signal transducer AmpG